MKSVSYTHLDVYKRQVLGVKGLTAPVLSYEEIGMEARPAMVGMVPP